MNITKLEAVKRQLNISIYLYFNDLDLVSAHTLAWASRNILYDLWKLKNTKESPIDIIKTNYRESYETIIRKAQNFFKHAGEKWDEFKKFEFSEILTENLLYDTISRYYSITKILTNHMKIFNSYFYIKNKDKIENQNIKKIVEKYNYSTIPEKIDFYKSFKD